ncbi:iron chaperone [Kibdelosporangium aridum]|uniref:iron chaperone n=1 Tax=Kibdelosporangium aridum TaxID=2030 RepID=UPI000525DE99
MTPHEKKSGKRVEPADGGWTDAEKAAMKERAAEVRKAASRGSGKQKAAADAQDVLDVIATMSQPDREIAERIHAIVTTEAPHLAPRLWYGMPAYALKGKVLCFYLSAEKEKERYGTLGFNAVATLDDGTMWPTSFALTAMTDEHAALITKLIKKAAARP